MRLKQAIVTSEADGCEDIFIPERSRPNLGARGFSCTAFGLDQVL